MRQGTMVEKQMARRTSGHCNVRNWMAARNLQSGERNNRHCIFEQGIHRMGK
jgi:hypothetical protein